MLSVGVGNGQGRQREAYPPPNCNLARVHQGVHLTATGYNSFILLTNSENDGIYDQHRHHKIVELFSHDQPLDSSPPGVAGTAARRHDWSHLVDWRAPGTRGRSSTYHGVGLMSRSSKCKQQPHEEEASYGKSPSCVPNDKSDVILSSGHACFTRTT